MTRFSELTQKNINFELRNDGKVVCFNDTLDFIMTFENISSLRIIIQLIYNEIENVYTFENFNISKSALSNNLCLICCVKPSEINTKKGTGIKLADGEIIPILHHTYNSTISANGLNDGENIIWYDASLNAFMFTTRALPLGSFLYIHNDLSHNSYTRCDKEIKGEDYPSLDSVGNSLIPKLDNRSLRKAGSLAPYNTTQEDSVGSISFEDLDVNFGEERTSRDNRNHTVHRTPISKTFNVAFGSDVRFDVETKVKAFISKLYIKS